MISNSFKLSVLLPMVLGAFFLVLAFFPASAEAGKGDFIVTYNSSAALKQGLADQQARGVKPDDVFRHAVKGFVAQLNATQVARLKKQRQVLSVEPDRLMSINGSRSTSLWGLDRIDQRPLLRNNIIATTGDGSGVTAYIIDTGIRATHNQFNGRVRAGYDAIGDGQNSNDCNGHGTHVAGTVAGTDYGVAPGANLVAVRVLDCSGAGYTSGVIAGIDWVVADHASGPAIANMSLGGGLPSATNAAVQRAVDDGITIAVAAGNDNADACNSSPASAPNALTVGATSSNDGRAYYSNYGSCLDIFAPGSSITSAWNNSDSASNTISGTSMAAPHLAGAAALILESNVTYTPAQVRSRLVTDATQGVVTSPGSASPNLLLFVGDDTIPQPDPVPPPAPSPPVNDNFSNAVSLSNLSTVTGTTLNATLESGEPVHVSSFRGGAHSIWYKWTAPSTGELSLSTQGSDFDTLLAVYSGSTLNSLTPRASNDDAPNALWSQVSFKVTAGVTYRIAVDGYGGASGAASLSGSLVAGSPSPPSNDNFLDALALTTLAEQRGSSLEATIQSSEPAHVSPSSGGINSVWYKWTAPSSGELQLNTQGSNFNTLLAVYEGDQLASLVVKASNDNSAPGYQWSQVSLQVTAGVTYQIAVDGYDTASGAISLVGSLVTIPTPDPSPDPSPAPKPPVNDNFSNAVSLSNLLAVAGTTLDATIEGSEPAHVSPSSGSAHSVWYKWTAPSNGDLQLSTQGSDFDTLLAVYSGDQLASLLAKASNNNSAPGRQWSQVGLKVSAGVTYRIAIDGSTGSTGNSNLAGSFIPQADPPPTTDPPAPSVDTSITSGPGLVTFERRPEFSFQSTGNPVFQCSLDNSAWSACQSPYRPASDLTVGAHSFAVRAINADGIPDYTPAQQAFVVQSQQIDNPISLPAAFIPVQTRLSVSGRTVTLKLACLPRSNQVVSTNCIGSLRLITSRGTSTRAAYMAPNSQRNISFRISAWRARQVASGRSMKAKLRIWQDQSRRDIPVTLVKASSVAKR